MSLHFLLRRPDVAQIDLLALVVLRQRLVHEVDVHRAGQGEGHHQRRAGQVVGLHVRIDAALEVAVARQHRRHHQVACPRPRWRSARAAGRCCRCRSCSRSRRFGSRACRGTGDRPGLVEVIGHHPAAGREAGLHVRLNRQPVLDGLLGQQAGGDHHRRVAGVGATGDGGDHHVAVGELVPTGRPDGDGRVVFCRP